MAEVNGINVPFIPITQQQDFGPTKVKGNTENFSTIFQQELDKVKFSNHALKRLENRNIQLSDSEINKIQNAVQKAESKGSKDSLVMMNNTAFVVNIPNRTVVTALPVGDSNENIFTNIDSVVFAQ
ncbi:MAG TPA: TIGR02530 family flagellar biosynthesis protein [Ignavibacteriaceae bacterium]|nr:TIGR02530 family flagellar biosynthesis protein [Ignavibacteriaceae bacterium]